MVSQQASRSRFGEGALHGQPSPRVLTPNVDVAFVGAHRISCNQQTLDQTVRIVLHEEPVDVGSWISFVSICNNKFFRRTLGKYSPPLLTRGKAGTPAPPEIGVFDQLDHFFSR